MCILTTGQISELGLKQMKLIGWATQQIQSAPNLKTPLELLQP